MSMEQYFSHLIKLRCSKQALEWVVFAWFGGMNSTMSRKAEFRDRGRKTIEY